MADESAADPRSSSPPVKPMPDASDSLRAYEFEQLAASQRIVLIRYRDQEYRLAATKAGKLVLTK